MKRNRLNINRLRFYFYGYKRIYERILLCIFFKSYLNREYSDYMLRWIIDFFYRIVFAISAVVFNSATVARLDLCAIFITNFGVNNLCFSVIGFRYIDV